MRIDTAGVGRTTSPLQNTNARTDRATTTGAQDYDVVSFSSGSQLLANTPLLLPTAGNLQKLSLSLSSSLDAAFEQWGVSTEPPIEIQVDGTGRIKVSGDRPDASQIEEKLNADPELAGQIRTTNAIGSHVRGMESSLQFQQEYTASDNPNAVVAKYGWLFGPQPAHET